MSAIEDSSLTTRRGFLKAAVVTAAAATATGTGAALVVREMNGSPGATEGFAAFDASDAPQQFATPLPRDMQSAHTVDNVDVYQQYALAQSDVVRLQSELVLAQQRIADLEGQINVGVDDNDSLRVELEEAFGQIAALGGLVALYQQLDEVDIAAMVGDGVESVSAALGELVDELPRLSEGIELGRQVLSDVEQELPAIAAGRDWFAATVRRIAVLHAAVAAMLSAAVERTGPLLEMLGEWVSDVLKWLPFGLGNKTSSLVSAVGDLLNELPDVIDGADDRLASPLARWLGPENAPSIPLIDNVVQPIRTELIDVAERAAAKSASLDSAYRDTLVTRMNAQLSRHEQLQAQIAQYRTEHNI